MSFGNFNATSLFLIYFFEKSKKKYVSISTVFIFFCIKKKIKILIELKFFVNKIF